MGAAIPAAQQPVYARGIFGSFGWARIASAITFVSRQAIEESVAKTLGLQKLLVSVWGTHRIPKRNTLLNNTVPQIEVDPPHHHGSCR